MLVKVSGLEIGQNLSFFFDLSGNPNNAAKGLNKNPVIPNVSVALENGGLAQAFTPGVIPSFTSGVSGASKNLNFTNFVANFVYTAAASGATAFFYCQILYFIK